MVGHSPASTTLLAVVSGDWVLAIPFVAWLGGTALYLFLRRKNVNDPPPVAGIGCIGALGVATLSIGLGYFVDAALPYTVEAGIITGRFIESESFGEEGRSYHKAVRITIEGGQSVEARSNALWDVMEDAAPRDATVLRTPLFGRVREVQLEDKRFSAGSKSEFYAYAFAALGIIFITAALVLVLRSGR